MNTEENISSNEKYYPVRFNVTYSNKLSRLTTLFRIIWALPILIVLATISGTIALASSQSTMIIGAGGALFLAPLLMILFRKKYPRWWFDWNVAFTQFQQRVVAYLYCITDRYPDSEAEQDVHLEIDYPDAANLCRWLPLIKWILAIPHYIVLLILGIFALFAILLGWISVIIIGRYPRPLFNYIVGVMRWGLRVYGYAFILVTDKYPPFRLSE